MGDPFSVGAGVVGVLSLTIQISRLIWEFGLDWKDAPKDIKNLMLEVQGLQITLSDIQKRLISNPSFEEAFEGSGSTLLFHLKDIDASKDSIREGFNCTQSQLEDIVKGLEVRETGGKHGWGRIRATLSSKRILDSILQLQRQSEILQKLVSIDTVVLSASTHLEIKAWRGEHQKWHTTEENQQILQWLSRDCRLEFEKKHCDILSKLHPGTGEWFLELDEFKAWRNGQLDTAPNLWCPGIPGAGKTVLSAKVIDHLEHLFNQDKVAVLYLYCDYKDKYNQTDRNLLASLAKQSILRQLQQADLPPETKDLYTRFRHGQTLSLQDCVALLKSSMNHFSRNFIVIDALDEHLTSHEYEYDGRISLLRCLYELQQEMPGRCTMLITSREMDSFPNELYDLKRLDIRAKDEDIQAYVTSCIHNDFPFARSVTANPDLADEIVKSVVEKAQGMFLLPRLHLDRLAMQISVRNLRNALKDLPSKLENTYRDAMVRIKHQNKEYCQLALRVLSWISRAKRPLQVKELQHAVSVTFTDRDIDDECLVSTALITSVCAGLVSIDNESNTFRLVHFTVEEFFETNGHEWFPDAERLIAETCLVYMLFDEVGRESFEMDVNYDIFEEEGMHSPWKYSLLPYAAKNWTYHAIPALPQIQQLVNDFLIHEMNIAAVLRVREDFFYPLERPTRSPGLHLFAGLEGEENARLWLGSGADINATDSTGNTALNVAMAHGNYAFARFLLSNKACVNATDKNGNTALLHHLLRCPEEFEVAESEILKLLINAGAHVNHCNSDGMTTLMATVNSREQSSLKLLLKAGADPNVKGMEGMTCLHYAMRWNKINACKVIDVLLEAGADIEALDEYGETPLSSSLRVNNIHAMTHFLQRGAKVDFASLKSYHREPPVLVAFQEASFRCLVNCLLRSGHHVSAAEGLEKIALQEAWGASGTKDIAEILQRDDVCLETKELFWQFGPRTPEKTALLITASDYTAVDIVSSLLHAGVKVDTADEEEENAFIETMKLSTPYERWIRFPKWNTYRNWFEKRAGDSMHGADELKSRSDNSVKLLLLWGLSWEQRQQVVATAESLPWWVDIWRHHCLRLAYNDPDDEFEFELRDSNEDWRERLSEEFMDSDMWEGQELLKDLEDDEQNGVISPLRSTENDAAVEEYGASF